MSSIYIAELIRREKQFITINIIFIFFGNILLFLLNLNDNFIKNNNLYVKIDIYSFYYMMHIYIKNILCKIFLII